MLFQIGRLPSRGAPPPPPVVPLASLGPLIGLWRGGRLVFARRDGGIAILRYRSAGSDPGRTLDVIALPLLPLMLPEIEPMTIVCKLGKDPARTIDWSTQQLCRGESAAHDNVPRSYTYSVQGLSACLCPIRK